MKWLDHYKERLMPGAKDSVQVLGHQTERKIRD